MIKRILLGLGGTPYTDVAIDLFSVIQYSMPSSNPTDRYFWHNRVPITF